MSCQELLDILRTTGIPWAYHHWETKQDPPYGIYLDVEDDPFYADDGTYVYASAMRLEVYSLERDHALDQKVRDALDGAGIAYYAYYTWIESEGLYESIFEIEV